MSDLSMWARAVALTRNGKLGRWVDRGTWTLIDRALFAVSNFALNVTLARWMGPEAYGAFALAFSIFLIIGAAQAALVTGPALIFGPGRYRDRFAAYLGLLIKGQMALSLLVSVCFALAGSGLLLWGSPDIGTVLLTLALAGPFILLLRLLRGSCYVHLQPKRAAAAGALYLVFVLAGTYLLHRLTILSPATALLLMAAASLIAAAWLAVRQGAKLFEESLRGDFAHEIALEHWRFGRWMLPARLLDEGRRNLFFLVLPIWGGLGATGTLRALMNLVLPIGFMQRSLNLILVPVLVRARNSGALHEKMMLATGFFVICSLAYGAAVALFSDEIIRLMYADHYGGYAGLVWLLVLIPVVNSVSTVLGSALRAKERPKEVFRASLGAAACAATIGVGAVVIAETLGAIIGMLLSACVFMVLLLRFFRSAEPNDAAIKVT